MIDPTCGVPTSTPCLPPRRIIFGPEVNGVMSSTPAVGPRSDFIISALAGGVSAPMRVVAKVAQTQPIGEPGDVVLIQGKTLSFYQNVLAATEVRAIDVLDIPPTRPPHAPGVKLRIQRCSFPGYIYIDANSHIYLPGGEAFDIDVMAPSNWTQIPGPAPVEVPYNAQFVDVRVTACVARCCPTRRSQLTMYAPLDEGARVLVPPGATEVQIFASVAGLPANTQWAWESTGGEFGAFGVNGGFVNAYARPGDMEVLRHLADGGTVDAMLVWTVE